MKKIIPFLLALGISIPLRAADKAAPQLPPIDAGAILAQIQQQQNHIQPQPIISPDMQFALEAAASLRKDLKEYGVKAKVRLVNLPGGRYALGVEFRNQEDYDQVSDMFYQDPGDNPSYMDLKVVVSIAEARVPETREDLNWKNIRLAAQDGTKIVIDYAPLSLGGETIASPFWVTVVKPGMGFTGGEKVRAVVMTYYDTSNMAANTLYETQELDLKPVYPGSYGHGPVTFQAKGQRVEILQSHIGYGYNFRQEIAVVVDGRWLADPVNGTHNFKFKLDWTYPYANKSAAAGSADKKIKVCWFKTAEKDNCVYKCKDGSTFTQPMQRPNPWDNEPVIACPQLVFPL
ncbi:MAG: hypothetical protein M0025_12865 [Elusimicrobia bacterium]|nr:hypothetical protein [Elusimicrobiota bacterium]